MASILVVGPHPDDQELGMGGTLALLASQGHRVTLLDMTNGEPTPRGDPATRAAEAEAARRELGEKIERRMLGGPGAGGLPNRFVQHTIEARHQVAGVVRAVQADILFVPYPEDAHPDHRAVTRIAEDARFAAPLTGLAMPGDEGRLPIYPRWLFYYYATHLRICPDPSFIVDTSAFADRKKRAVLAYKSQFVLNEKNRGVVEWVEAAGRFFGSRIGAAAGEPFFTREPLGLTSLASLPI